MLIEAIVMVGLFGLLACVAFSDHLPKWACTKLGWHVHPTTITSTYGQLSGRCPRCDKHVLMDSQGNWF